MNELIPLGETDGKSDVSRLDPEWYFDISSGKLLLGTPAVDQFIEAGGHPADLYELSKLINSTEVKLLYYSHPRVKRSREELIENGKWLTNLLSKNREGSEDIIFNEAILARISRLGLISIRQIRNEFGSLSNFYAEINENRTFRKFRFDTWTLADFGNHVAELGAELGRKPTRRDIDLRATEDVNSPSAQIMKRRYKTLGAVHEAGGWVNARAWDKERYTSWGVKFMLANDGKLPTQRALRYLSKRGLSPSDPAATTKFGGSLLNFQEEVKIAYGIKLENRKKLMLERGLEIGRELEAGNLTLRLFNGAKTPEQWIERFARFKLATALLPSTLREERYRISKICEDNSLFVAALIAENQALDVPRIEKVAGKLDAAEIIWPTDVYMTTLRIEPEELEHEEELKLAA